MSGRDVSSSFVLGFTHRGRRKRNEDAVRERRLPDGGTLVVVCDGMGGHAGGDFASAAAADGLIARVAAGVDPIDAIVDVNRELFDVAAKDPTRQGMGTTLVAALVRDGRATIFNVGDSRGYACLPDGTIRQVTVDHSFVAESIAAGTMDAASASASRYKNALTRAIATEPDVAVDRFGPIDLTDGTVLLLCSDGFYKATTDASMAESLHGGPSQLAPRLEKAVLAAFDAGSDDNISTVLVGAGSLPDRVNRRLNARLGRAMDRRVQREERRRRAASPPRAWGLVAQRLLGVLLLCGGLGVLYVALVAEPRSAGAPISPPVSTSPVSATAPLNEDDGVTDSLDRGEPLTLRAEPTVAEPSAMEPGDAKPQPDQARARPSGAASADGCPVKMKNKC